MLPLEEISFNSLNSSKFETFAKNIPHRYVSYVYVAVARRYLFSSPTFLWFPLFKPHQDSAMFFNCSYLFSCFRFGKLQRWFWDFSSWLLIISDIDFLTFLCIWPNFVFKAQVVPEYTYYYYDTQWLTLIHVPHLQTKCVSDIRALWWTTTCFLDD